MLMEKITEVCTGDLLMLFGPTGSGKSTFALEAAKEFVAAGKKVLYVDTEKNVMSVPKGLDYKYFADFNEMDEHLKALPKGYDLVVLDSIGLPVLGKFARLNAREKGDILLKGSGMSYDLKVYCQKNSAIGIVTNQPESEFNKNMYHVLRPFLDKAQFFYKEIWKTKITKRDPNLTTCVVESFRSRFSGRKTPLFEISITNSGTKIESKV